MIWIILILLVILIAILGIIKEFRERRVLRLFLNDVNKVDAAKKLISSSADDKEAIEKLKDEFNLSETLATTIYMDVNKIA
ncbi:hypothetical protein MOO46_06050 [Apilactobacillus apisilvae]|uniref:Uncharacterized protein n=1 Tax=Apilactobacillus apisilvae TaxID=2923364 RepID=A0ABY4PG67_9LACO|nr:hypothetical protein [Apilactobacillus apisilvae]UQS84806.1 hypothetical protein MOO46_06050 [Apilactobacillus apisilvae]